MARSKRRIGIEVIRKQIEAAQEEVIKTKHKYDEALSHLKELLDKEKEIQTEELMAAVVVSKWSYDEIMRFIQSDPEAE